MDLFEHAEKYPRSPGWKEPTTSKAAAKAAQEFSSALCGKVLLAISQSPGGLTADEAAQAVGADRLAIRPRITELRHLGKIERVPDVTRANASGRQAAVWRRKPDGREVAHD